MEQTDRIVADALHQLNDSIGHRPVAVLRTERKIQPYDHEWVAPIPLWIRGVAWPWGHIGNCSKPALAILDATDPALLADALFALDQLDEVAYDPRAYNFDHPVSKRPNYLFGQWDMHKLDNAGRCRRLFCNRSRSMPCSTGWKTTAGCRENKCCSRKRPSWPARC